MIKTNKNLILVVLIIALSIAFPAGVFANSAEPPGLTVIVSNPPADLSISIRFSDALKAEPVLL